MDFDVTSVLVVTKDSKISQEVKRFLMPPLFEVFYSSDFNEARRLVRERSFKIVLVDFDNGDGADFASDINELPATILLMVPPPMFDQVSYRAEAFGILTMTKPFDSFYFYNMIKVALAVQAKIDRLTSQTVKLKEKMEEIRLVNRAKMLLMSHCSMTEEEAHHHLEKEAMNNGIRRTQAAQDIIRRYSE